MKKDEKKGNYVFFACLLGTVLLAAGVIFLPRYFSRSLDMRELGHVEVSKRDDFSFLELSPDEVLDNVLAFRNMEPEGGNLTLIFSAEMPMQVSQELLDAVYEQVMAASAEGMVPWAGNLQDALDMGVVSQAYINEVQLMEKENGMYSKKTDEYESLPVKDWATYLKFARNYSLSYPSEENPKKKEMLNFWYLRFSDDSTFDYYFVVHAATYRLYYAEIHSSHTDYIAELAETYLNTKSEYYDPETYEILTRKELINSDFRITSFNAESARGCSLYYGADGFEYINYTYLYEKLGMIILYYDEKTVYLETSLARDTGKTGFRGVRIGFQELVNKIDILSGQGTSGKE